MASLNFYLGFIAFLLIINLQYIEALLHSIYSGTKTRSKEFSSPRNASTNTEVRLLTVITTVYIVKFTNKIFCSMYSILVHYTAVFILRNTSVCIYEYTSIPE